MAKLSAMEIPFGLSITSLVAFAISVVAIVLAYISNHYAAQQLTQTATVKAMEIMEATRDCRHILYPLRKSKKEYPDDWTEDEKKAAIKVSRAFDILGILDATKQIDKKFVDRFYAIPAIEMWQVCEDFVKEERKDRGEHYLWEFQQFAERVKFVKRNHPSYTKRETWPCNPRHKYAFTVDFQNEDA